MQDIAPGTCKVITGINAPGLREVAPDILEAVAIEYIFCGEPEATPGSGACARHTEPEEEG